MCMSRVRRAFSSILISIYIVSVLVLALTSMFIAVPVVIIISVVRIISSVFVPVSVTFIIIHLGIILRVRGFRVLLPTRLLRLLKVRVGIRKSADGLLISIPPRV